MALVATLAYSLNALGIIHRLHPKTKRSTTRIPRRDALVEELRALYTEFAPKLADALARVVKLDREIKRAGEAPDGRELAMVEAAARGFTHLDGMNHLTLTRAMVLPDWRNPEKRIWPPYDGAPDPDEQRLDLEAWRVAERHVEQEKYAA